jgi:U3 small nucleolar RNA-associated protein 15
VLLYDASSGRLVRQFTRFRDSAYSGVVRDDGGALAAGGEDGRVQLFDAHSRAQLRAFTGHARAAHCVRFCPGDRTRLASGGDDGTLRLWDVTAGVQATRLDCHGDYLRALAHSPGGQQGDALWATGSYDGAVKLWDLRSSTGQPVFSLRHAAQVEDLAFFPSGGLLASAGGEFLCLWDLVGGGRLLRRMRPHAKALTCVRIYSHVGPPPLPEAAQNGEVGPSPRAGAPRMLTGSLDGTVKVFELDTFRVTHAARYPGPVLSLGMAPDASAMAVGCANGTLAIRRRARPKGASAAGSRSQQRAPPPANKLHLPLLARSGRVLDAGSYRYFIRGQSSKAAAGDAVAAARRRAHLRPYDSALRRFRHRDALDAALSTRSPAVVAAVLDALAQRAALASALAGRDAAALTPLIRFLAKHVAHPRHTRLLASVATRVLDIYTAAVGADAGVDAALALLAERLAAELRAQEELMALQGALEPLLCAALRGRA